MTMRLADELLVAMSTVALRGTSIRGYPAAYLGAHGSRTGVSAPHDCDACTSIYCPKGIYCSVALIFRRHLWQLKPVPNRTRKISGKTLKAIWRWNFCAWWKTRPSSRRAPWARGAPAERPGGHRGHAQDNGHGPDARHHRDRRGRARRRAHALYR